MRARLAEVKKELRKRMHRPIPEQGSWPAHITDTIESHEVFRWPDGKEPGGKG
jgi:hypothetical protein